MQNTTATSSQIAAGQKLLTALFRSSNAGVIPMPCPGTGIEVVNHPEPKEPGQ